MKILIIFITILGFQIVLSQYLVTNSHLNNHNCDTKSTTVGMTYTNGVCYPSGQQASVLYSCNSTHQTTNICSKNCDNCKPMINFPNKCQAIGEHSINRDCGKITRKIKKKGFTMKMYYNHKCEGVSHQTIFYTETCLPAVGEFNILKIASKNGSTKYIYNKNKKIANIITYTGMDCSGEVIEHMKFKPKKCYVYRGTALVIEK
eukprot:gene11245-4065_t